MSNDNIIEIFFKDGVRKILLNRPKIKNAFNGQMCKRLSQILKDDSKNDNVVVTIITGAGDYYSSGNDIKASLKGESSFDLVKEMVETFIDYPKLLIAVLNGPAIGIAATTVALCDIVYASDRAYLHTPFVKLGLCVEGTSSYLFPRILGKSNASETIFLGKRLTSQEAYRMGLVSQVIPHEQLPKFIESLYKYGDLSVDIIKINKKLVMGHLREKLHQTCDREFEGLQECANTGEFVKIAINFMQQSSKL